MLLLQIRAWLTIWIAFRRWQRQCTPHRAHRAIWDMLAHIANDSGLADRSYQFLTVAIAMHFPSCSTVDLATFDLAIWTFRALHIVSSVVLHYHQLHCTHSSICWPFTSLLGLATSIAVDSSPRCMLACNLGKSGLACLTHRFLWSAMPCVSPSCSLSFPRPSGVVFFLALSQSSSWRHCTIVIVYPEQFFNRRISIVVSNTLRGCAGQAF